MILPILEASHEIYRQEYSKYAELSNEREHLYNLISEAQESVETVGTKMNEQWDIIPDIEDTLIQPLGKFIRDNHFPARTLDISGPFGLGSKYYIYFHEAVDSFLSLVISPGSIYEGELFYETGETTEEFSAGSIGEINGFNRVTKQVENINELVEHLNKQLYNDKT